MRGDFHVRFCGRLGAKFPLPTRQFELTIILLTDFKIFTILKNEI